jgi:hypothetical protein
VVHERQLPAEVRPEMIASSLDAEKRIQQIQSQYQSTLERAPAEHRVIEKTPIIEEHIKKTVIEEIQPVIHKEVVEPHIIREVKPIYEKIVEAPTVTRLVKEMVGLNLDDHYRHHSHHGLFLSGNQDCQDCKNYHQFAEACQLCKPLHFYEGCGDCGKLRDSGLSLPPFPGSQNMFHSQHHLHHNNVINKKESCYNCSSWHSSQNCVMCKPEYSFENCNECSRLRGSGMVLPKFSGMSYPTGYQMGSTAPYQMGTTTYQMTSTAPYGGQQTFQTTTGFKEGPATTSVTQKRVDQPAYKSL